MTKFISFPNKLRKYIEEEKEKTFQQKKQELEEKNFFELAEMSDFKEEFSFEEWNDLCEKWLKSNGFEFRENKNEWYDLENEEWTGQSDACLVVSEGGYEGEVAEMFFEEEKDLDEWIEGKAEEAKLKIELDLLFSKKIAMEIRKKIKKVFGQEMAGIFWENFKTGGQTAKDFISYLWESNKVSAEELEETGLLQRMRGASVRHNFSDYDLENKFGLSEVEIENLRKEKTKEGWEKIFVARNTKN